MNGCRCSQLLPLFGTISKFAYLIHVWIIHNLHPVIICSRTLLTTWPGGVPSIIVGAVVTSIFIPLCIPLFQDLRWSALLKLISPVKCYLSKHRQILVSPHSLDRPITSYAGYRKVSYLRYFSTYHDINCTTCPTDVLFLRNDPVDWTHPGGVNLLLPWELLTLAILFQVMVPERSMVMEIAQFEIERHTRPFQWVNTSRSNNRVPPGI